MALLVKNFTHNGETYPEAVVKIAPVFLPYWLKDTPNHPPRVLRLIIWASKADYDAKKPPLQPYGSVTVMDEKYAAYFSEAACKPEGCSRWGNAYQYCKDLVPQYRDAADCRRRSG